MSVTKGPPISGKLGQYGPKGVTKPVNTGYGPPVKKVSQVPKAKKKQVVKNIVATMQIHGIKKKDLPA